MSLKLGTYPVQRLEIGSRTSWDDGTLTIDKAGLTESAAAMPNIESVSIDIACPGESARIIEVNDLLEPRIKVDGPGTAYPGVCNRALDTVGSGVTYRLGGLGVVESVMGQRTARVRTGTAEEALNLKQNERPQNFVDMSGPGAITPASGLCNVCVSIRADEGLGPEDQYLATHSATLKVVDGIAEAVRDLEPPELEEFDTADRDPSLPGVVFICNLMSMEFWTGPDSRMGTAVYGVTRLSAPWLIQPEEMFDGAVSQRVSWHFTNNPVVRELISRHGRDLNFLGCIIQRTNWGGQREMQLSASRSAQMAKMLGADGAIITTNIRGRRFVDTVLGIQACERAGIRTTLITEEEDDENGKAPPAARLYARDGGHCEHGSRGSRPVPCRRASAGCERWRRGRVGGRPAGDRGSLRRVPSPGLLWVR